MKVIFLGTNGWYNTHLANTICTLVETAGHYIILDAGDGIYKIDRYIKRPKPIHLFLTHPHLDHISGFHILNKFNFPQGITVYCPVGMKKLLAILFRQPYSIPIDRLAYGVRVIELKQGEFNFGFRVLALRLKHSVQTLGYRIEVDNRVIAYCADTGVCPNALRLAEAADLVIAECSLPSGQEDHSWPHLNPQTAALVAKKAHGRKLCLTHFNPFLFPFQQDRLDAQRQARAVFKNSFCAKDGRIMNLHEAKK